MDQRRWLIMLAIIDIGSNTIRMNVYKILIDETLHQSGFRFLFSEKEMAGLASHIEDNELSEAGLQNLLRILKRFRLILDNLSIETMFPFATASLRKINNSSEVLDIIKQQTNFDIHLISGKEEGRLGFLGSRVDTQVNQGLMTDIGGGSTELVHFKDDKIFSSESIALGSLGLYKEYVEGILPNAKEQKAIKKFVRKQLKDNYEGLEINHVEKMVGIGGSIRATLKLHHYLLNDYESNSMTLSDVENIINRISDGTYEAQAIILKVISERVHTILPGLIVLREIMKYFDIKEVVVSQSGVREGYLIKHVLKKD